MTKKQLRKIIKEEIQKIQEGSYEISELQKLYKKHDEDTYNYGLRIQNSVGEKTKMLSIPPNKIKELEKFLKSL